MKPLEIKEKALADYRAGDPLKDIAVRYDLLVGTVSLWAKKAGLTRRSRGTRHKTTPSVQDLEIVSKVEAALDDGATLAEIGQEYGYTRSGIHRIYHKWKNWKGIVPFKAGDLVRFDGRDYEVIKPGVFVGTVRDLKTGEKETIVWRKNAETFAVKL